MKGFHCQLKYRSSSFPLFNTVGRVESSASTKRQKAVDLYDEAESLLIEQIVNKPTRANNLLDLVFTNMDYNSLDVSPVPSISDHNLIQCKINMPSSQSSSSNDINLPLIQRLDTRNMDDSKLRADLLMSNWSSILEGHSPDVQKQMIIDKLTELMQANGANPSSPASPKVPKPI